MSCCWRLVSAPVPNRREAPAGVARATTPAITAGPMTTRATPVDPMAIRVLMAALAVTEATMRIAMVARHKGAGHTGRSGGRRRGSSTGRRTGCASIGVRCCGAAVPRQAPAADRTFRRWSPRLQRRQKERPGTAGVPGLSQQGGFTSGRRRGSGQAPSYPVPAKPPGHPQPTPLFAMLVWSNLPAPMRRLHINGSRSVPPPESHGRPRPAWSAASPPDRRNRRPAAAP